MEYTFKITENGFTVEIETKIIKIKNKQRKKDKNEFYINNSYYIKLPPAIIKYYNTKKVYIEQLNNTHYKISTKESINSTITTIKENKVSILVLIEFIFNSTYFLSIGSIFMFICFIFYSFCGRVKTI